MTEALTLIPNLLLYLQILATFALHWVIESQNHTDAHLQMRKLRIKLGELHSQKLRIWLSFSFYPTKPPCVQPF
jgi:hypothetical protein